LKSIILIILGSLGIDPCSAVVNAL